MRYMYLVVLCLVALLAIQPCSFATAYYIGDQDAKAQGMGSNFVAQADNPSAIFYNPAGITQLKGTQVSVGGELINFLADYKNPGGEKEDLKDRWEFLPNAYVTSDLGFKKFAVGLGIDIPFGLSTNWSNTGLLRYDATFTKLEMVDINPTIAYQIFDQLSIGAGIDYYYVREYELNAMQNYGLLIGQSGAFDGRINYQGDGSGWGFNLGLLFKPHPKHSFGLTFRNAVDVDTNGKFKATNIPSFVGLGNELSFDASSEINFPAILNFGYAFRPIEKLKLEADFAWQQWSVVEALKIKNKDLGGNLIDKTLDWNNAWTLGLGAEYLVTDQWALRAGYMFLKSAIPDKTFTPAIPNLDRNVLSIGTGYTWKNIEVNIAYSAGISGNRTINENNLSATDLGTYHTFINEIAVSAGCKF